jgi:hypothetical protein
MFWPLSARYMGTGLAMLAVAGCSGDGPTGSPTASIAAADQPPEHGMVPFKAKYNWRIVSQAPLPGCDGPGEARAFLEGAGTATQLGSFTITLNHCGRPNVPLSDGHGTFVAANGDRLYITYFGVGGLTGAPPIFGFESAVSFVGGTGRLANSTGEARVLGTIDIRIGGGTGDWEGEISQP